MDRQRQAKTAALRGASVLVVEDDSEVLDMTAVVLERAGARVTKTATAEAALKALSSQRFSCAVVDWNLGPSNAERILTTVRSDQGALAERTVVVTGDFLSSGEEASARRYGFAVLSKPFRPRRLVETLAGLLG